MPANNELENYVPQILASAIETVRDGLPILQNLNTTYSDAFRQRGDTIEITEMMDMQAKDVVPGYIPPDNASPIKSGKRHIPLNYWREVAFELNDKEIRSIIEGVTPQAITKAANALRDDIAAKVWDCYKLAYKTIGEPGELLFDVTDGQQGLSKSKEARVELNKAGAAPAGRTLLLDVDSEGDASVLPAFTNAAASADSRVIAAGVIGTKQGFDWMYDTTAPYHTKGDLSPETGWTTTNAYLRVNNETPFNTNNSVIRNYKYVQQMSNTGADTDSMVKRGDLFSIAGDPNMYVVLNDASPTSATSLTVEFYPEPPQPWANGSAVTWFSSHQVGLAFQTDAIAFVMAPFIGTEALDSRVSRFTETLVDADTGMSMRYELQYFHKLYRHSIDILYGVSLLNPELVIRLVS